MEDLSLHHSKVIYHLNGLPIQYQTFYTLSQLENDRDVSTEDAYYHAGHMCVFSHIKKMYPLAPSIMSQLFSG